jgi:hypothetical protein
LKEFWGVGHILLLSAGKINLTKKKKRREKKIFFFLKNE